MPPYLDDVVSWAAIGARTVESPQIRYMVSGLSCPVGIKNATSGQRYQAVNAVISARAPHSFGGITADGRVAVVKTTGNPWTHVILRGGDDGPNYDIESIRETQYMLAEAIAKGNGNGIVHSRAMDNAIVVDCNHGNSGKDHTKQPGILYYVIEQRMDGNPGILGVMIESNIHEGNQPINGHELQYGVSVTDSCLGLEQTYAALKQAHEMLRGG